MQYVTVTAYLQSPWNCKPNLLDYIITRLFTVSQVLHGIILEKYSNLKKRAV